MRGSGEARGSERFAAVRRTKGRGPLATALVGTALALAVVVPSTPAGATSPVALIDAGQTFSGVVAVGSNVWAYAQGDCGSNPSDSLEEFGPSGQLIQSVPVGPALVPCTGPEPIATNGTDVAVLDGDLVTVIDGTTGALVTSFPVPDPELLSFPPTPGLPVAGLALSGSTLAVMDWTGAAMGFSVPLGFPVWETPIVGPCDGLVSMSADQGTLAYLCAPEFIGTLDMTTGALLSPSIPFLPLGPGASIVVSGGYAFVTDGISNDVVRLSVPDPLPEGQTSVPGTYDLTAMGVVGPNLWVGSSAASALWPIDLVSGNLGAPVDLPSDATSVAGAGDVVWATLASGGLAEFSTAAPTFIPSSVTLAAPSGASPVVGSPTTLSATVSTPGTVTFYDGSSALAGCTSLAATATVTCAWTPTTVGSRSLSATLEPTNGTYARSTSPTLTLNVAPEPTTVTPSFPTGSVASGHVSLSAAGSVPGTLTFSTSGSFIPGCVGLAAPSGSATCETSLGAGTHEVTVALAPYSANDAPSSATRSVKVVAPLFHGSVPFDRGSSDLGANGRRILAHLVRVIVADGYTRVSLFGRGDGGGTTSLARARAATVAAVLRHELSGVSVTLSSPPSPSAGSQVIVVASL